MEGAVDSNQVPFLVRVLRSSVLQPPPREPFVQGPPAQGPRAEQDGVAERLQGLLPLPLVRLVVVGVAEHGVENEERYQQVRQVYRQQRQALALRLRSRMLRLGEIVKQDVRQDGKQRRGYVGGVDNRRRPYPFAATCIEAKRKEHLSALVLEQAEFSGF